MSATDEKKEQHIAVPPIGESDSESQIDYYAVAKEQGVPPAFLAKSEVLNNAIREIGFGRFQIELFFTAGAY